MNEMTAGYKPVIEEICGLNWQALDREQLSAAAWAYYYFSIQFRENLELALALHPEDALLKRLVTEECDTDNLSPWDGVAVAGEKMNHDEFMRRALTLTPIDPKVRETIEAAGRQYLERTRHIDDQVRAMSIASYECGGLESVFTAMLRGRHWDTKLLEGFRHFLVKHIGFDSDVNEGHGALIHHLVPNDTIRPLWVEFRNLLIAAVPALAH
jgi:hypothetical protein